MGRNSDPVMHWATTNMTMAAIVENWMANLASIRRAMMTATTGTTTPTSAQICHELSSRRVGPGSLAPKSANIAEKTGQEKAAKRTCAEKMDGTMHKYRAT